MRISGPLSHKHIITILLSTSLLHAGQFVRPALNIAAGGAAGLSDRLDGADLARPNRRMPSAAPMWSRSARAGRTPSMPGFHWTGLGEHPTPRRGERIERIAFGSLAELRVRAGKAQPKYHPDQVIVGVGFGGGAAIAFLGVPVKEPQAGSAAFAFGICCRTPHVFRKVQAQPRAPIEAVVCHGVGQAAVAVSPRRSVEPDVGPIPALVGNG